MKLFTQEAHIFFSNGATAPSGPGPPHYRGFTIILRHTLLGRTPLDEWAARCRALYVTIHNNQKIQTSMPPAEFKPVIPASERPQTQALERAATGIDRDSHNERKLHKKYGSETPNHPQLFFHSATSVNYNFATKDFTWFPTCIRTKYSRHTKF
jgi:hypothetical protein